MFQKLLEQFEAVKFVDKILETYKRVETDKSYVLSGSKSVATPVATLADEYGGRVQIGVDDGCYVLYLKQDDGTYKHTAWIFPEAHEALKDLPNPREAQKKIALAKQGIDELFENIREADLLESKLFSIFEGKNWEYIAKALYQILDDVANNVCKESFEAFRDVVMKLQVKKLWRLTEEKRSSFIVKYINVEGEEKEEEVRADNADEAEAILMRALHMMQEPQVDRVLSTKLKESKLKENLIDFAREELELAGLFDKDSDYEGMLGEAVMELIQKFADQGHSGMSAAMTTIIFDKLSRWKPLTELTDDPREWMEIGEDKLPEGTKTVWQSKRSPSCFSHDGGKTYYDLDEMHDQNKKVMHNSKHIER